MAEHDPTVAANYTQLYGTWQRSETGTTAAAQEHHPLFVARLRIFMKQR